MLDMVQEETTEKMQKAIEALKKDLLRVRTGRASATLLDGVRPNVYGAPTPVSQVASISVPESRLIIIQPWDPSIITEIEKAILKSDLGLTPTNDGKLIRIHIPPLNETRRKEMVKVAHKIGEEHKVVVRNIRRDANESLKKLKKDGDIAEDALFKGQEQVQKLTDSTIKQMDELCQKKEKEILEF